MHLNKPIKILIGILTLIAVLYPFVILPAFMMFFIFSTGFPFMDPSSIPDTNEIQKMMPFMMIFYPFIMCFSVVQVGLQIFYIIHEVKNKVLTETFRILFAIGTFFLPYIAMPIYFIAYLWNDKSIQGEALPVQTAQG